MKLEIYAAKSIWFTIDINTLCTIPEDMRQSFLENEVRKHVNNVHEIKYSINCGPGDTKIPDSVKEKTVIS